MMTLREVLIKIIDSGLDIELENASLFLFDGIDPVAEFSTWNKTGRIKTIRCNKCGKCCTGERRLPFRIKDNSCEMLYKKADEVKCSMGTMRPFACCVADVTNKDYCCIEYKEF